jgi:CxxC motif-containing protein (DUF1111 family)
MAFSSAFYDSQMIPRVFFGEPERTLETPRTSYGSHMSGVNRAVTSIRYTMAAFSAHPTTISTPRFNRRSSRFCFFRCPWMRSACSGTKSDSMRVPVFSSSGYVSIYMRDSRRRIRTFAWPQERNRGRYCDESRNCKDEEGEELSL